LTGPAACREEDLAMLRWALIFLVIALIAAVFGFGGVYAEAVFIARILFFVFLILFVISLLTGRRGLPLQ